MNLKKHKSKLIASALVAPQLIAGIQPVLAAPLTWSGGDGIITRIKHDLRGSWGRYANTTVWANDVFHLWTINGKMVWCIEPTVNTMVGANYTNIGDVVKGQNITVRHGTSTVGEAEAGRPGRILATRNLTQDQRLNAAILPTVLISMPLSEYDKIVDLAHPGNEKSGRAQAFKKFVREFRKLSKTDQWSHIQILYWNLVSDIDSGSPTPSTSYTGRMINKVWKSNTTAEPLTGSKEIGRFTSAYDPNIGESSRRYSYREITAQHEIVNMVRDLIKQNKVEYIRGAEVAGTSAGQQRLVYGASAEFKIKSDAYIKVNKEIVDINAANKTNVTKDWDFSGIKVGVYSNKEATSKVTEMTLNKAGDSNVVKVKPDQTYYLYELNAQGQPIKQAGQQATANYRGFASGGFVTNGNVSPVATIRPTTAHTQNKPLVLELRNTPELVNIPVTKISNVPLLSAVDSKIHDQYVLEGTVIGLYKDAQGTQPVTRNGQNVTTTINRDGNGLFENLIPGKYYIKEISAPKKDIKGIIGSFYTNNPDVFAIDVSNTANLTKNGTSTDATSANYPANEYTAKATSVKNKTNTNNKKLIINKVDAQTKKAQPQGQGKFVGAEFEVLFKKPGSKNILFKAKYTTDANGKVDIKNKRYLKNPLPQTGALHDLYTTYDQTGVWPAYDYYIEETKAPDGYLNTDKDGNVHQFDSVASFENNNGIFNWDNVFKDIQENNLELSVFKRQKVENDNTFAAGWQTDQALAIPGVTFTLTYPNGHKENIVTNNKGQATFKGLIKGNYTLEETKVPDGYIRNTQKVTFTVNENNEIVNQSRSVETDDNGNYTLEWGKTRKGRGGVAGTPDATMDNIPRRAKAQVVKTNEKGAELQGAEFTLYHIVNGARQEISKQLTNDQGIASFDNLIIGDVYEIEETKAPKGYKLPRERKVIEFRPEAIPVKNSYALTYKFRTLDQYDATNKTEQTSSTKKVAKENTNSEGLSFYVTDSKQMAIQFDMVNNTWKKLPNTGSNTMVYLGGAALTLVMAGAAYYIVDNKKKKA